MYRVVIVEDDPMVSLLNRTFVERDARFQVVQSFQDGRAALAWLEQNPADLAVLDVYMPLFTGLELPRWVKQLKFWSTSCLTMTFLTVVFILAPMYEDGNGWYIMLFTGSMLYHHFLNPVVAMVSFLLFEREPRLPLASVPLALVPTIVYGVYDLWGNITGRIDGPYPFMRVYDQTIQESLMWFAIILGTNLLYAFVLWWLGGNGKKHRKKGPKLEFMG